MVDVAGASEVDAPVLTVVEATAAVDREADPAGSLSPQALMPVTATAMATARHRPLSLARPRCVIERAPIVSVVCEDMSE